MDQGSNASVTRSFIGLGAGEAAARFIAFATTLIIARRLGADGLGVVSFAFAVLLYFQRVVDAGFDLGIGIREAAARRENLRDFVPPVLTLRLLLAEVAVAVTIVAAALIHRLESDIVALYALTLIPLALSTRWVLTGMGQTRMVGFSRVLGEAITLIVVFIMVAGDGDLWRVPMSQLLGDTAAAFLLLMVLHQYGIRASLRWDPATIRPLVRHVTPFVGSALLGLAIFNSDLLFLRAFSDRTTVGLYAAAYALVSFLINVGATYSYSLIPSLTHLASDPRRRQSLYDTSWARAVVVVVPIAVGGALIARQVITAVFGPEFSAASTALTILLISVPLSVLRSIASAALMAQGREDILFRTVLIAACVNVALNLLAIPAFGMVGAALVTVTTELLRLALAQRHASLLGVRPPLPQRYWKTGVATILMAATVAAGFAESLVAVIAAGATAYAIGLLATRAIRRNADGHVELWV